MSGVEPAKKSDHTPKIRGVWPQTWWFPYAFIGVFRTFELSAQTPQAPQKPHLQYQTRYYLGALKMFEHNSLTWILSGLPHESLSLLFPRGLQAARHLTRHMAAWRFEATLASRWHRWVQAKETRSNQYVWWFHPIPTTFSKLAES